MSASATNAAPRLRGISTGRAQEHASWQPSFNPWLIAASVMLATFMEVLDTSVANVSLPHIAGNLSASTDEATWVLTSYLVSNAIVLPATGWITSVFGRKRFLITCIIIFTLSSVLCGAANSLGMLIVARVLQGAGGGALQPIAQAVLLESFPPEKRGAAMAVYGMGVVVAPIIGPTLGGWITDNYSWRWIFYINLPVGVLAILMAQTFVEDPPYLRRVGRLTIDYIGFSLMALWLATLQIILDKGQEADWFQTSWVRWFAFISGVSMVGFIVRELSIEDPIVNLRILANRNFAIGTMIITLVGAVLYGTTAMLPLFLQNLLGYPPLQSGIAVSPRGIGSFLAMIIVGRLTGLVDGRLLIAIGFCILSYALFMFGGINLNIAVTNVVWPNIINGLALGFIFVPLTVVATGTLTREQISGATGIYNLMRNIGGSFGISGVVTMLARQAQTNQAQMVGSLSQYNPAFQQRLLELQHGLAAQTGSPAAAAQAAYGIIYGTLVRQANVMAYIHIFRLFGFICLICVPLIFFTKKVTSRGKGAVAAH